MITNNDIKKAKFKCYSIYMQFQAVMAGQSVDCEERLENEFNDIFSRFYRGDPSRTKFKKSGSGLGLSITKKIINNNKGFIKAFNHKDGGAIFETIFPCLNTDL